jgi:uncharacterized protein (DUF1684 family)
MDYSWGRELHWIDLADWREQMARSYRERDGAMEKGEEAREVWERWRATKDVLFSAHPQSPLGDRARRAFVGLRYFPYDPAWRIPAILEPVLEDPLVFGEAVSLGTRFRRAARLKFDLEGAGVSLMIYWIDVYGGSLFLPFRDATGDDSTYEGGRYLIDTAKGSDFQHLHGSKDRIVVDFNYAYNPSCAYDDRWSCPLAPRENCLTRAIRAGEMRYRGSSGGDARA